VLCKMPERAFKALVICSVILQVVHEFNIWTDTDTERTLSALRQTQSERFLRCLTCSVQLVQSLVAPEMFTVRTRGVSGKAFTSS